jgi:hypothetical protein
VIRIRTRDELREQRIYDQLAQSRYTGGGRPDEWGYDTPDFSRRRGYTAAVRAADGIGNRGLEPAGHAQVYGLGSSKGTGCGNRGKYGAAYGASAHGHGRQQDAEVLE